MGGLSYGFEATKRGIQIGDWWADSDPVDVLTWGALTRHRDHLPARVRHHAKRVDATRHTTFPMPEWDPHMSTAEFIRIRDQREAWSFERYLRVRAMTQRVLDLAFPLAVDEDEPADLFEVAGIDPAP